ncbi:mevalonate kinase [Ophiocordyceps camponoti-floridani]|uniref:Mevalonate kinase n=1 Tax=Ophiocordyceps camponoti-floridani TaxID=2030778 RepID=A0A8H4VE56_9HYPO|nr:mevalonate kinase [Ophiocordyceps camponoti-floridani]
MAGPNTSLPAFMVSAPGKVIVFGEHSVVYDKSAIAAAISLRSYLHVAPSSSRIVTLRLTDINLVHEWPVDDLPWPAFKQEGKKQSFDARLSVLDPDLVAALQPHVARVSMTDCPDEARKVHRSAALAFLYLLLSLHDASSLSGCRYTLRSTIPIGAGLGSSASVSVCLATAFLLQRSALVPPHSDQTVAEALAQVERINNWAFVGEMCIHGKPSGVDNTVVSQGRAVLYRRGHGVRPLWTFPQLPLLLIDTRQAKSTAQEVAKVVALKEKHPDVVASLLEAMDQVTGSADILLASRAMQAPESVKSATDRETGHLGELMRINHGLLVSLGVSHPRIERVRELVDHNGLGWTKLTGSGGGGCCIALKQPGVSEDDLSALRRRLLDENYQLLETTLGGEGVGLLCNGARESDIDVDDFVAAEDTDGIEVVINRGKARGEGWKFWGIEGDMEA